MKNWKKVLARNVDKYFTKVDDGLYVSLSKEGVCYAVTTHPRIRPFNKRLDTYVLEIIEKGEDNEMEQDTREES